MSRRREVCQEGEKFVKKERSLSSRRDACQEEEKFVKKEESVKKVISLSVVMSYSKHFCPELYQSRCNLSAINFSRDTNSLKQSMPN